MINNTTISQEDLEVLIAVASQHIFEMTKETLKGKEPTLEDFFKIAKIIFQEINHDKEILVIDKMLITYALEARRK